MSVYFIYTIFRPSSPPHTSSFPLSFLAYNFKSPLLSLPSLSKKKRSRSHSMFFVWPFWSFRFFPENITRFINPDLTSCCSLVLSSTLADFTPAVRVSQSGLSYDWYLFKNQVWSLCVFVCASAIAEDYKISTQGKSRTIRIRRYKNQRKYERNHCCVRQDIRKIPCSRDGLRRMFIHS